MKRNVAKSLVLAATAAAFTAACAMGGDLFKRSLTSPTIDTTKPMLTVYVYDGAVPKHRALLDSNSKAARRLQTIVDGPGWRPTLATYVPNLYFKPESGADFTLNIGPKHAIANYEKFGILRQRIRDIDEAEYKALLSEVYASAEPILKNRKKTTRP